MKRNKTPKNRTQWWRQGIYRNCYFITANGSMTVRGIPAHVQVLFLIT